MRAATESAIMSHIQNVDKQDYSEIIVDFQDNRLFREAPKHVLQGADFHYIHEAKTSRPLASVFTERGDDDHHQTEQ